MTTIAINILLTQNDNKNDIFSNHSNYAISDR